MDEQAKKRKRPTSYQEQAKADGPVSADEAKALMLSPLGVAEALIPLIEQLPEEDRLQVVSYLGHYFSQKVCRHCSETMGVYGIAAIDEALERLKASSDNPEGRVAEGHIWAFLTGVTARGQGYVDQQDEPEEDALGEEEPRVPTDVLEQLFAPWAGDGGSDGEQ